MLIGNKASTTLDMSNNAITNVTTLTASTVTPTTLTGWNVKSLTQGTNVTITNDGSGGYTINSSGGGGSGNTTSIGRYWDYGGGSKSVKVSFGSLGINLLTQRVRGVIHIKIGTGDFGYPIISFNSNHSYPSFANYTNEASRTLNISHPSTYGNNDIFSQSNTNNGFSYYQDKSMCFANLSIPSTSGYITLTFDINLQKQQNNSYTQLLCVGEWNFLSKTIGSTTQYLYTGLFTRVSEVGTTLDGISVGGYSNGNAAIEHTTMNLDVINLPTFNL
jgi:hypothetical protein